MAEITLDHPVLAEITLDHPELVEKTEQRANLKLVDDNNDEIEEEEAKLDEQLAQINYTDPECLEKIDALWIKKSPYFLARLRRQIAREIEAEEAEERERQKNDTRFVEVWKCIAEVDAEFEKQHNVGSSLEATVSISSNKRAAASLLLSTASATEDQSYKRTCHNVDVIKTNTPTKEKCVEFCYLNSLLV
jgi:hypothetical protein